MKYAKDPVIEEIRETRNQIFKRFNNDPHAFGKYLMEVGLKRKEKKITKNFDSVLNKVKTKKRVPDWDKI